MSSSLRVHRQQEGNTGKTVLSHLWHQLLDEKITVQEASQAIFIGNESLLSNLTFLLHHLMRNPSCITRLRAELDTLNVGLLGHRVWRDPQVLKLPYLVCLLQTAN